MKLHWDGNMADKYIKFTLTNQKTVIYIDEAFFTPFIQSAVANYYN